MHDDEIKELLTNVAQEFDYRFNLVLTDAERLKYRYSHTYILTPSSTSLNGLQVRVYMDNDEKALPRWKLGFIHNHEFQCVEKIGCSLNKSRYAIAEDIKRRLLCSTQVAMELKQKRENKTMKDQHEKEMQELFVRTLRTQFNIKTPHSQRFNGADFEVLDRSNEKVGRFTFRVDNPECQPVISLSLTGLSDKQLFEILNIVK